MCNQKKFAGCHVLGFELLFYHSEVIIKTHKKNSEGSFAIKFWIMRENFEEILFHNLKPIISHDHDACSKR